MGKRYVFNAFLEIFAPQEKDLKKRAGVLSHTGGKQISDIRTGGTDNGEGCRFLINGAGGAATRCQ